VTARTESVEVEIVDFAAEHAAAFRGLNVEWLEKYFVIEPVDECVLSNPEAEIIAHGGFILMASRSGNLVGTVALKHHGSGVFELTKMAVTERNQGQGIGRRLLAAAIDRFRSVRGTRLYLESHSSLIPALHLYESQGFRHVRPPRLSEYRRADVYMVYSESRPGAPNVV
jgi:ribosomal protein S18 acetylase RimI-like enzyme